MTNIILITHVTVCLFLIAIVLLQHGKGADIGATFGGSSQSLFGTEGPVPLLNKITTIAAIVFMGTSVTLAYISVNKSTRSVMSTVTVPGEQQAMPLSTEQMSAPAPESESTQQAAEEK
ncbi:MAG: preprotein translocase subunit SecG [Desulfobulbus propionicus]|nr:MAG: preprotein translocase subunit SecG [Desulfobulbus propionicus]